MKRILSALALALAASATAFVAPACSSSDATAPTPDASPTPASDSGNPATDAGDAGDAAAMPTYDFSQVDAYLFGGSWKTEGAVVLVDGNVVWEKYAAGFTADKRHITYSVSKSVGSALIGIAVHDGLLKLSESICTYVPAPSGASPSLCDTTIEDLLQMTSGLQWSEDYGSDPTTSNVLSMLYGTNSTDMGQYVAALPRANPAGTLWNYSSGDANLLAKALKNALGSQDVRAWAKAKLFDPAKLTSAIFEEDHAGTLVFSSSCFMTPRDMARFGAMYLTDGLVDGSQVLPQGWAAYSATPAKARATATPRTADAGPGDSGGSYGAAFWLNAASKDASQDTFAYPQAPADMFAAEGHWGQGIYIIPSKKMVVVRVGNDRDVLFDAGPMLGKAIAAVDAGAGR